MSTTSIGEDGRSGLSEGREVKLTVAWLHARNTLALVDSQSRSKPKQLVREKAEAFLRDFLARGYQLFRAGFPETSG